MKTVREVLNAINDLIEKDTLRLRVGEFVVSQAELEEFDVDLDIKALFTLSNNHTYDGSELELESYVSNNERTYNLFSLRDSNAEELIEFFLNL